MSLDKFLLAFGAVLSDVMRHMLLRGNCQQEEQEQEQEQGGAAGRADASWSASEGEDDGEAFLRRHVSERLLLSDRGRANLRWGQQQGQGRGQGEGEGGGGEGW